MKKIVCIPVVITACVLIVAFVTTTAQDDVLDVSGSAGVSYGGGVPAPGVVSPFVTETLPSPLQQPSPSPEPSPLQQPSPQPSPSPEPSPQPSPEPSPLQQPSPSPKNFVKAQGTKFTMDGKPWYCSGTNAYYAALQYIMPESEVGVMMKGHADRGVNVLRVFAHSNFDSVPEAMMPGLGQFNEDAIKRLDLALDEAAKHGIRLILVLGNYWPFTGGAQAWVDKTSGYGKSLNMFYTDETIKGYFKGWIQHLITRTNTVNGMRFADDPTIMAWELINEPRLEKSSDTTGALICAWVKEMAGYIKSLDSNHMVCTGEEGFRAGFTSAEHAWMNDGYEGVDFKCNTAIPEIDFATIHAYPDQWGFPSEYTWLQDNFFRDRADIAKSLGKPIILEEYGQAKNFYGSREQLLEWLQARANENGFACTLVWAVSHKSTDGKVYGLDDQGYVFVYDQDGSKAIVAQNEYMKNKRT